MGGGCLVVKIDVRGEVRKETIKDGVVVVGSVEMDRLSDRDVGRERKGRSGGGRGGGGRSGGGGRRRIREDHDEELACDGSNDLFIHLSVDRWDTRVDDRVQDRVDGLLLRLCCILVQVCVVHNNGDMAMSRHSPDKRDMRIFQVCRDTCLENNVSQVKGAEIQVQPRSCWRQSRWLCFGLGYPLDVSRRGGRGTGVKHKSMENIFSIDLGKCHNSIRRLNHRCLSRPSATAPARLSLSIATSLISQSDRSRHRNKLPTPSCPNRVAQTELTRIELSFRQLSVDNSKD